MGLFPIINTTNGLRLDKHGYPNPTDRYSVSHMTTHTAGRPNREDSPVMKLAERYLVAQKVNSRLATDDTGIVFETAEDARDFIASEGDPSDYVIVCLRNPARTRRDLDLWLKARTVGHSLRIWG